MQKVKFMVLALVTALVVSFASSQDDTLTAGFIYVGPVGDYGWTYAHDLGRQAAEGALPWLETIFIESVAEAEVESFIDQLVRQGAEVIFTTSFGYMDGTLAAAERYPDVIFAHATGFQRAPNVATYTADFYQIYYLNGLLAGALSETDKLGYIAAFPIPEVKRHINAFTLGAQEVNPDIEVDVRWIYEWFSPAAAAEATEALIAEGADVFAFTEDTPTVIQVAAESGYGSFGHYSDMLQFAPDHVISGQIVNWEIIYIDFLQKVRDGVYTPETMADVDYFYKMDTDAVAAGATEEIIVNPVFDEALQSTMISDHPEFGEISVYDLMFTRLEQMDQVEPAFDPFTGPMMDRQGNEVLADGEIADLEHLLTMQWAATGVIGPWPDEP
ncbi:MAG: BMP family ABC transporter substrate-binding protein [Deinococcota bacterium]